MTRWQILVIAVDLVAAMAAGFGWGYVVARRRWYERGFRAGASRGGWPRWQPHKEKS